jgi:hypothetical protein
VPRAHHELFIPSLPPAQLQNWTGDPTSTWNDYYHLKADSFLQRIGANMGEVIRFVPKSERERARLVQEARAIYDSIFPPADPVREPQDKVPISLAVSGAKAHRGDGGLLS